MTDRKVIPFTPLSGADLVAAARMARAVPPKPTTPPAGSIGSLPRQERLRALAGVAQAMLAEAHQVLDLIAAGRVAGATGERSLTRAEMQDLARMALIDLNPDVIPAMVGDIEAIHGR